MREAAKHYDENRQTAFAFEAEDERRQAEANRRYWDRRLAKITEELDTEEYISKEVDPILDKISKQGIQSLTARERRILEKARQKMEKKSE